MWANMPHYGRSLGLKEFLDQINLILYFATYQKLCAQKLMSCIMGCSHSLGARKYLNLFIAL
jgi:hypothetical protein